MFELLMVICLAGGTQCTHGIYPDQTFDSVQECMLVGDQSLDELQRLWMLADTGVDAEAYVYCSIPA